MPAGRRDELIDAAMRVFYRHGFHGTCLDKVLEEGGISRMTIYNHFASKEELIIAALRRRDEIFRNRMMKSAEAAGKDPVAQIRAVFDFHRQWFAGKEFCGCMFINACAEFGDPESPIRRVAADHKEAVLRYLRGLCEAAKLSDPAALAEKLNILLEGATVTAQVVGRVGRNGASPEDAARRAKEVAELLIEAARAR